VVAVSGLATLRELETTWTLDDVARALAFLNVRDDLTKLTYEEVR
jgi:hypothetical protein